MFTQDQIAQFRLVDSALRVRAQGHGKDIEQWAEDLGPDALDTVIAEECEALGVDFNDFTAWAKEPDADSEVLDAMGAFDSEPLTMFEEQRVVLSHINDNMDTSIADAIGEGVGLDNDMRTAIVQHVALTAWAIAQRFRIHLSSTLKRLSEEKAPPMSRHDRAGTVFCMLEEIDHRNKDLGASACASHEFCDANLPMADAWKDIVGRLPEASLADDMHLWDMAWTIAKREGFASPVFSPVATN